VLTFWILAQKVYFLSLLIVCINRFINIQPSDTTGGFQFYPGCGKRFAILNGGYVMFKTLKIVDFDAKEIQTLLKDTYRLCCTLGLRPVAIESVEKFDCLVSMLRKFTVFVLILWRNSTQETNTSLIW
jgi:hypothetical protein